MVKGWYMKLLHKYADNTFTDRQKLESFSLLLCIVSLSPSFPLSLSLSLFPSLPPSLTSTTSYCLPAGFLRVSPPLWTSLALPCRWAVSQISSRMGTSGCTDSGGQDDPSPSVSLWWTCQLPAKRRIKDVTAKTFAGQNFLPASPATFAVYQWNKFSPMPKVTISSM